MGTSELPWSYRRRSGGHVIFLALLLSAIPKTSAGRTYAAPRESFRAGESINIFPGYGYLREGFHILPANYSRSWIIREPTFQVLRDVPLQNDDLKHRGDIEFEFCYGPLQLVVAYFRHFKIEGIPEIWKSFVIGWDRETFSKWMGITKHYMSKSYSYILVRIVRKKKRGWLEGDGTERTFLDAVEEDADQVCVGDEGSVLNFFNKHGTHYVSSYTTGGLMYQVYAYSHRKYGKILAELKKKNVDEWSKEFFDFVFSPFFADHTGSVMLGSRDPMVGKWMGKNLNSSFFIFSHQSLLKAYRNESVLEELAGFLGDDVLVQMDLKTLTPAISDNRKRAWVEEILHNRLSLWDVSM